MGMRIVYLGVDGGTSGTRALLVDACGTPRGYGNGGNANHQGQGVDRAVCHIATAVGAALDDAGVTLDEVDAAFFAVAGCDVPDNEVMLRRSLANRWPKLSLTVRNDVWAGLRAGSIGGYGVAINCGMGGGAVGRRPTGQEAMIPDIGYLFGDSGGGLQIARDAFRAVSRAGDGRGPTTMLTTMVLSLTNLPDVEALRLALYNREIDGTSYRRVTPLVLQAADSGDTVACAILDHIGEELGIAAAAVARRLHLQRELFTLVLTGGTFRTLHSRLAAATIARVRRDAPFCVSTLPLILPVGGAALLALDSAGIAVAPENYAILQEQGYGWPVEQKVA